MSLPPRRVVAHAPIPKAPPKPETAPVKPAIKKLFQAHLIDAVMAGMLGGATEALCLQPLDVAKTRLQLDKTGRYKRSLFSALRVIAQEEGVRAWWRGLTVFQAHLVTKYAWRFGAFAKVKELLGGTSTDARNEGMRNFAAGLFAGVSEAILIVTPFERVKTVWQKQGMDRTKAPTLKNPIHALRTLVETQGLKSLWYGATPTIIRQASNQAALFTSFPVILALMSSRIEGDGEQIPPWQPFAAGLLAAAVGPLLNCPVDVIKTRMMAMEAGDVRLSWFQTGKVIVQENGVRGLWSGLIPRLARIAPGQAITFTVVTRVCTMFEQRELQK